MAKRLFDISAETQASEQGQVQVRLSKLDADSRIFFTTNGKEPGEKSSEYIGPITLTKTTTLRAMTPTGGRLTQTFTLHKAKNKPYTYASEAKGYGDEKTTKLTDGVRGETPRDRRQWTSFYGTDMDLTLDLGDITSVTKVSLNFLKIIMDNGFPPSSVEIALSRDGQDFKEAIAQPVTYELPGSWDILPVVADFRTARARYVRVRAKNAGPCPAGHPNAGAKTWFATDEIVGGIVPESVYLVSMETRQKIVVLSGAGVSAESGIPTFRASDGLWENHRIEDVATPEAWQRNPDLVQDFYNQRRKQALSVLPNAGHYALVKLEEQYDVTIITQNVDNLHEKAGIVDGGAPARRTVQGAQHGR